MITFLKILLSNSIIYIVTIASPTVETSEIVQRNVLNYNLSDYILPLHYNVTLSLEDKLFIFDCKIIIYVTHATQYISYHLLNPKMMGGFIMAPSLTKINDKTVYNSISENYDKSNIVVLKYDKVLLPGMYNLDIWIGVLMNKVKMLFSTYISDDGHKEWLITSLQTKNLLPSWNKPELRITFDFSIKHHSRYTAWSNMPIREFSIVNNNMMETHFKKTGLVSIDDVAFMVFKFDQIYLSKIVGMWCNPQLSLHAKFALHVIESVTIYLKTYWNNSKRFFEWTLVSSETKVNHVAIPNLQDGVKPTLGFVFHREEDIIYNVELDPVPRKMIIARLIAREMAQKYIGNLLYPSYWFHLWLNESFIKFLQVYIINKVLPNFRMMNLFVVQVQHEVFDLNSHVVINSAVGYNSYSEDYLLLSSFSHFKGSIIWRMLERILSPDKFLKAINIYLNIQYTDLMETTPDNLWNAMQSVIDELDSEYQFNIKSAIHSWAMQRCFPVLEVMRNYSSDVVIISVKFHNKLDQKQYHIPVTYTTEQNPNFIKTWLNMWLTPLNSKIELFLEKDQWIILNLQQAGYYRVNYDNENWQKIARYLNSEEYRKIHVLNRAQIIDDAFHFTIEKKLKPSVFWELATYLQKEKQYTAWYPMLKAFEFMSNVFAFLQFPPQIQKVLKTTWNWYRKNRKYDYRNNDHIECLRQELSKWKCITHDSICRRKAHQLLLRHLRHPERNKLSRGWKRWAYCNGLKTANRDTWNKVFDNTNEIDHTILECLAYINNSEITINYLEIKLHSLTINYDVINNLSNKYNISYDQSRERAEALLVNIFFSILAERTEHMLEDILNNFRIITSYYGMFDYNIKMIAVIINKVYNERELDKVREFVKKEFKEIRGPFLFNVLCKIETRRSEIERQKEFLQYLFIE